MDKRSWLLKKYSLLIEDSIHLQEYLETYPSDRELEEEIYRVIERRLIYNSYIPYNYI